MIRKIMTEEEREKKSQRNRTIMSLVLAVIMLLSTAGYFVMDFSGSKEGKLDYNNIEFKQNDYGAWQFTLNSQSYETMYNPKDTENISVNTAMTVYNYANQPLYFSAEPVESIPQYASQEILRNIGGFTARNNYACLDDNCSLDYAIKNCSVDNVIVFKESENNKTRITQEENCVKIEYKIGEAERASDAFLFKILGV